jgi:hypothetical protein
VLSYRSRVTSSRASKVSAIAVYTGLRLALFLAVWLTIELLTPISGLWAIVAALLISGALSIVLLDRQRGRMAAVADGFFKGLNERIEASARAEDVDDEPVDAAASASTIDPEAPATADADSGRPSAIGEQGEQEAEGQPVGEHDDAGLLQGGHEGGPDRTA